jgi:G3E family GTPase
MSSREDQPIPVTLLAGFLGSGKTTLLNRILTAPHGRRVVVVVNEFGEANIDSGLIVGGDEDLVELQGGCLCCTVREDLRTSLRGLLERRNKGWFGRLKFDQVVIEASGLASPGPAVQTLLVDAELAQGMRPAGVVTLIHAGHIVRQLREHPEAAEQVAYADHILLNHCDGKDEETLLAAQGAIAECNAQAPVQRCERAAVDIVPLLDLDTLGRPPLDLMESCATRTCDHSQHSSGVGTVTLRSSVPLDGEALRLWLKFLSRRRGHDLLRAKGILRLAGKSGPYSLQGIYQWLELAPLQPRAGAGEGEQSVLVLIGRDLDQAELERGWRAIQQGQPA